MFFNKKINSRLSYFSVISSLIIGLLFFPSTDFQSSILVGNLLPLEFFSTIITTNLLFCSFTIAIVIQLVYMMIYCLASPKLLFPSGALLPLYHRDLSRVPKAFFVATAVSASERLCCTSKPCLRYTIHALSPMRSDILQIFLDLPITVYFLSC